MQTLKEQYKEIVGGYNEQYTENVSNKCVEIAQNYSAGFVDWLGKKTMKELLNFYKMKDGIKDFKSWQDFQKLNYSEKINDIDEKLKKAFKAGFIAGYGSEYHGVEERNENLNVWFNNLKNISDGKI